MNALADSAPQSIPRFRPFGWKRHALVAALMAAVTIGMYGPRHDAAFAFDDEPNILRNPYFVNLEAVIQDKALSLHPDSREVGTLDALRGLWRAAVESPAGNRPLTNFTFAWNIWRNEYHIAESYIPERYATLPAAEAEQYRAYPVRDFHHVNIALHWLCGLAVYGLFLRLVQLPRVPGRLRDNAWFVATGAALVWLCSPVQSAAVMYIVQRAVLLAACFYLVAFIAYLEFRALDRTRPCYWGKAAGWLVLCAVATFAGMLSKEITALLPLGILLAEYFLIMPTPDSVECGAAALFRAGLREARTLARQTVLPLCCVLVPVAGGVLLYYGKVNDPARQETRASYGLNAGKAVGKLWEDAVGKVFSDEPRGKTRISRRQRLLTETRVVAMYQSLLIYPGWWRLNLDYDFPETTALWNADEVYLLPLVLVLGILAVWRFSPPGWRGVGVMLAVALAHMLGLERVWWEPWPVPAIVWHLAVIWLAIACAGRHPHIAFCILWFYAGHLIESTIIGLELVYEHRLYLPSTAFYLLATMTVFDAACAWKAAPDAPASAEGCHV